MGESGLGDGQFASPDYLAVDRQGNVYVSDKNNYRVQKFDSNGKFLLKWGSEGGKQSQFYAPSGITLDSQNNVYVADTINHRIQKFDSNGNFILSFGQHGKGDGDVDVPRGLVADKDDNIFEVDSWNRRVQKFDKNGKFLLKWGQQGNKPGEFAPQDNGPEGATVDPQGNVYITDPSNDRIQKFDTNGTFLGQLKGNTYDSPFYLPISVAFMSDGTMYVSDGGEVDGYDSANTLLSHWDYPAHKDGAIRYAAVVVLNAQGTTFIANYNRVQSFDRTGHFLTAWGGYGTGDGQFRNITALAVDALSNVYIVDSANKRVQKFDSVGRLLLKWGDATIFTRPEGIAVDPQGAVYVADGKTRHILKFDKQGKSVAGWENTQIGKLAFDYLHGLVIDTVGNFYIAIGDHITKYDSAGNSVYAITGHHEGSSSIEAFALDPQGNVYSAFSYYLGIDHVETYFQRKSHRGGRSTEDEKKVYSRPTCDN